MQQLAAAITSGGTASPQATRRARAAEAEAEDTIAMARAAYEQLESDLRDVEREAERMDKAVNVAVAEVLRPTALRMTEEAKHFRAEYLRRQHAIDAMAMSLDGFKHLDFSVSEAEHRALCSSVRQSWMDKIAALKTDADASLPG